VVTTPLKSVSATAVAANRRFISISRTDRTSRPWDALSGAAPDPRLNDFRQLPFSQFLVSVGTVTRDGT
jgi:hypothetical protein